MIALDLFAGHGWGVACKRLGITRGRFYRIAAQVGLELGKEKE